MCLPEGWPSTGHSFMCEYVVVGQKVVMVGQKVVSGETFAGDTQLHRSAPPPDFTHIHHFFTSAMHSRH